MTIRAVTADKACTTTLARLDDAITVAHTADDNVLLLNLPREIKELGEVLDGPRNGLAGALRRLLGRLRPAARRKP